MSTEINKLLLGIQTAEEANDKIEIRIGLLKLKKSLDQQSKQHCNISAADFEGVKPEMMYAILVGGLLLMAQSLNG